MILKLFKKLMDAYENETKYIYIKINFNCIILEHFIIGKKLEVKNILIHDLFAYFMFWARFIPYTINIQMNDLIMTFEIFK